MEEEFLKIISLVLVKITPVQGSITIYTPGQSEIHPLQIQQEKSLKKAMWQGDNLDSV